MPTTASDLSDGQIAMVGEARNFYEHEAVCTMLFNKMTLEPGEKSKFIPKFGQVIAKDLTDGVDMTEDQALTLTGTTHTTDEAGCKVIITKKLRNQLKEDAYRQAGKVIGNAMTKKIDQDGHSLYSGLSKGLGSGSTTFSIDYQHAGLSQLWGQDEPAPEPIWSVYHPYTYHEVKDLLATPGTNNLSDMVFDKALLGKFRGRDKLFGSPIFVTGNIQPTSSNYAYGCIASKMCFIYLVGWEPDTWVEEDKSLRGWEIGIVADYAMVEEDDNYGRYMYFNCAEPTS